MFVINERFWLYLGMLYFDALTVNCSIEMSSLTHYILMTDVNKPQFHISNQTLVLFNLCNLLIFLCTTNTSLVNKHIYLSIHYSQNLLTETYIHQYYQYIRFYINKHSNYEEDKDLKQKLKLTFALSAKNYSI